jgi:hypothetical protein
MAAPGGSLPALRGRALLDWALQPLLRDAHAAGAWALLARVLRADSQAGAALSPALWAAVARACEPVAAAADGELPQRVCEVLCLHRLRHPFGQPARGEPLEPVAAAAVGAVRRTCADGGGAAAWRCLATELLLALALAARAASNGRKVRARALRLRAVPLGRDTSRRTCRFARFLCTSCCPSLRARCMRCARATALVTLTWRGSLSRRCRSACLHPPLLVATWLLRRQPRPPSQPPPTLRSPTRLNRRASAGKRRRRLLQRRGSLERQPRSVPARQQQRRRLAHRRPRYTSWLAPACALVRLLCCCGGASSFCAGLTLMLCTSAVDAAFLDLLPWLTSCFATAAAQHAATKLRARAGQGSAGVPQEGFVVVRLLLASLRHAMRVTCARGDAAAWCSLAAASACVLRAAHQHELCQAANRADMLALLSTELRVVVQQCTQLGCARAAASASVVLGALLDVDVHLLEPHLPEAWRVLCVGSAHAHADCAGVACAMVVAFGDTRLLPKLLLGAMAALCGAHSGADVDGALLCRPQVAAAWSAASARLPPGQAPEMLQCVRACLALADASGLLCAASRGSPARSSLRPVAELLAATVAGIPATLDAAAALAETCAALQLHVGDQLQKLPLETGTADAAAALLLRLCTLLASLMEACCACTSGAGVALVTVAQCTEVACTAVSRLVPRFGPCAPGKQAMLPWCQLEVARCVSLLTTWRSRGASQATIPGVSELCAAMLTPSLLGAAPLAGWDGVVSTVDADTLPCALWQLVTEHMAPWCVTPSSPGARVLHRTYARSLRGCTTGARS